MLFDLAGRIWRSALGLSDLDDDHDDLSAPAPFPSPRGAGATRKPLNSAFQKDSHRRPSSADE